MTPDIATYEMMMQLSADIAYYSDRINHRRLGNIRRSLQKIEDAWMVDRDIDGFRTSGDERVETAEITQLARIDAVVTELESIQRDYTNHQYEVGMAIKNILSISGEDEWED